MKLTWSNKDSIMTCTGRHREREMVLGMAAGKLEHMRKCDSMNTIQIQLI
jgi:hypothetical protein